MTTRQRLWLLLPPAACCAADVGMTFAGQPSAYWCGDFASVDEFNPLARALLQHHPLAFLAAAALWLHTLAGVLLRWKHAPLLPVLAFGVTFCHAVAAAAWMARRGAWGLALALAFLVAVERLVALCWRRAGVSARDPAPRPN